MPGKKIERKVPYKFQAADDTGDSMTFDTHAAHHVEILGGGLSVLLTSRSALMDICYPKPTVPHIRWVELKVFHFGQLILSRGLGDFRFTKAARKSSYVATCSLSVGAQKISIDFSGEAPKHSKRDSNGHLPAFLHLKIEDAQ